MPNEVLSAMETARANSGQFTGFDMARLPKPDRFIYIYSVSKRDYPVHTGLLRTTFRGCHNGERYVMCAEIPDPFHESVEVMESGRRRAEYTPGLMVAMDAINNVNFTGNQDLDTRANEIGEGNNLNVRGLWWSENNPPTEHEIVAAEKRLAKRYEELANKVLETERSSPKDLQYVLNEESREALTLRGIETSYHKLPSEKATCPNCGEMIRASAKFHKSTEMDMICVMPNAEAWKSAVAAGAKKAEDVPEQFRDKRGPGRPPLQ